MIWINTIVFQMNNRPIETKRRRLVILFATYILVILFMPQLHFTAAPDDS